MNKLKNANWKLLFDKAGTILVDRRFWLRFVFPTVIALGVFPYLAGTNAEYLSDQAFKLYANSIQNALPLNNLLIVILSGILLPYLFSKKKIKTSIIGIVLGIIFIITKI